MALISLHLRLMPILFLTGCASGQLNYNTLDIASTVGDIQTQQVLFNLGQFEDNPFALPAQIDLGAGAESTSNTVAPTIGTPLSSATSLLTSFSSTASASPSVVAGGQSGSTVAGATGTLTASNVAGQSWAYTPVTNPDELRRLRALYGYALGELKNEQFLEAYPLVKKLQSTNYDQIEGGAKSGLYCQDFGFESTSNADKVSAAKAALDAALIRAKAAEERLTSARSDVNNKQAELDAVIKNGAASGKDISSKAKYDLALAELIQSNNNLVSANTDHQNQQTNAVVAKAAYAKISRHVAAGCKGVQVQTQIPDEMFLRPPGCVVCMKNEFGIFRSRSDLFVNPRLASLNGGWLLDGTPDSNEYIVLGRFGRHHFYIKRTDQWKLSELTLYVLGATQESGASQSVGSSSSSSKPNKANLQAVPPTSNLILSAPSINNNVPFLAAP